MTAIREDVLARLAGDGSHYSFAALGPDGLPTEHTFRLPSVTTIIKSFTGGPPPEWGFKVAVEGILSLVNEDGLQLHGYDYQQLKEELGQRACTPWHIRDAGAVRGTRVHSYLEQVAQDYETFGRSKPAGQWWTKPEDGYEQAVLDWWQAEKPQVVAQEVPLWSLKHGFAGTVDLIWFDHFGNRVLTDLKTHKPKSAKNPAYLDDLLQLGAYRLAWNEMHPDQPIDCTSVLIVTEDGKFLEDKRPDRSEGFLALLELYRQERAA